MIHHQSITFHFESFLGSTLNGIKRLLSILGIEKRTSCDQPISPTPRHQFSILRSYSSIDLYIQIGVFPMQVFDLAHHICHKFLTPEARLHCHHQHLIHQLILNQPLNDIVDLGLGLHAQSHLHSVTTDTRTKFFELSIIVFTCLIWFIDSDS